jgi:hypothetical protein
MSRTLLAVALGAAALSVIASARGQTPPAATSVQVEARPVPYESPFKGYRRLDEPRAASWPAANDLVHRLGGWKAFASGKVPEDSSRVDAPESQPPKPAVPTAPPAAAGHAGHTTK